MKYIRAFYSFMSGNRGRRGAATNRNAHRGTNFRRPALGPSRPRKHDSDDDEEPQHSVNIPKKTVSLKQDDTSVKIEAPRQVDRSKPDPKILHLNEPIVKHFWTSVLSGEMTYP